MLNSKKRKLYKEFIQNKEQVFQNVNINPQFTYKEQLEKNLNAVGLNCIVSSKGDGMNTGCLIMEEGSKEVVYVKKDATYNAFFGLFY